jgi:DNA mismatch repair endonuclease MutH
MNSYNEVRQALDPVVGVPFKDLAPAVGIELPKDPKRRKGAGGQIAEALLDIARNSIPKPDLIRLGTEVKTISLNTLSTPREWTKVSAFNLNATKKERDFLRSTPYMKLRCILFVPIMKADNSSPDFWYLRPPFLWLPTEEQLSLMETDYAKIQMAAHKEDWTRLAGRSGRYLTLNTSDSKTAGKAQSEKRRAWWLTREITREVCKQNLWPREAIEIRRDERA